MTLDKLLIIAAALFCCGLYTVMTRRNAVAGRMGVEVILNAANINFVAFSFFLSRGMGGQIFAVFVIVLAAAEAAVAGPRPRGRRAARCLGPIRQPTAPSSAATRPGCPARWWASRASATSSCSMLTSRPAIS